MRARPHQRPCPHGREQPPGSTTNRRVRGLRPRTFTREAGVPEPRPKAELSAGTRSEASLVQGMPARCRYGSRGSRRRLLPLRTRSTIRSSRLCASSSRPRVGLAHGDRARELRRTAARSGRPGDAGLPPGRVHLPLAGPQLRRARPTADPRRHRSLPGAPRSDRDGAGVARHERSRHRLPADAGRPRPARLARRHPGLPARAGGLPCPAGPASPSPR